MICYSPNNTDRFVELLNSENNQVSLQDMSHFVVLPSAVMDVRPHGPFFFSALQFKTWYKLSVDEVEDFAMEKDEVEGEEE